MTGSDLKAEVARLAARVAELEDLLTKPPMDRPSLYRMTDAAPWGAMVINREGGIEYTNPAFQRWLRKPTPATGELAKDVTAPALWQTLEAPVTAALGGLPHLGRYRLADLSGGMRDVRISVAPRGGGAVSVTGCLVSLYDDSESLALYRTARENEERLAHINAVTPSVIYIFDVDAGRLIWAAGRTQKVLGYTPEELVQRGAELRAKLAHPDDLPKIIDRLQDLEIRPDGDVCELEVRVRRSGGSYRWVLDRAAVFERDRSGRVIKTISAAVDIDERKRLEERRTLLINELNHRVKNTLAAVQSIARQTLRVGRPPERAFELFTDRLVAMSAAHDVLTRADWESADLREIVEGALRPFEAQGEGRIDIDGPNVRLSARAALAFSLALHELATNASKYGALSNEKGRARLSWTVVKSAAGARLVLEWRESGGPPVRPPTRTGFGSRLLTHGLPAELEGSAELDFAPEGLVCRISAPLEATPALEPV